MMPNSPVTMITVMQGVKENNGLLDNYGTAPNIALYMLNIHMIHPTLNALHYPIGLSIDME